MLQATYLTGPFGALPGGIKRPKGIAPLQKMVAPLLDGPRWIIGPWNFPDDGKPHVIPFTRKQFGSQQGLPYQHWLGNVMGQAMDKWKVRCAMGTFPSTGSGPGSMPSAFPKTDCRNNWRGWSVNMDLPRQMWDGKVPLAQTTHPTTGKKWAFYTKFEEDKVTITFKEVPPGFLESLFGAIWDFVTTVVGFIVDTVTALFDFLKTMGCALARPQLSKLAQVAAGSIPGASVIGEFSKYGMSAADLQKVEAGASSTFVKSLADKVVGGLCGPATKANYPAGSITAQNPKTGKWVVASPKGAKLPGLKGAAELHGPFDGFYDANDPYGSFGATTPSAADPTKKYTEITPVGVPTKPTGLITVTYEEYKKLLKGPWYMRPVTWAVFGVVVAGAGYGAYKYTSE